MKEATPVGTFLLEGKWNNEVRLNIEVGDNWYVHEVAEKLEGKPGEGKKKGYTAFHYIVRDLDGTFSGKIKRIAFEHQDEGMTAAYNGLKAMFDADKANGKKTRFKSGLKLEGKLNMYTVDVDGKPTARSNWEWYIAHTGEINLSEEHVYDPTA